MLLSGLRCTFLFLNHQDCVGPVTGTAGSRVPDIAASPSPTEGK
ncbi:MAG: hypothetical protein QG671_2081 [Actinomycetota bacterium]|nr:hypothetical protein [Actinomycetota bacterium]